MQHPICTATDVGMHGHQSCYHSVENLTFTDAQREFCENEETCLYDLVVTGDESIAATTKESTQNIARLLAILGECIVCNSYPAWCVYGIYL